MRFTPMRGCRRPVREQRYIFGLLGAWESLSSARKMELRGLIDSVAGNPDEARALWEVLRGRSVEAVAAKTFVPARRIYEMRCRFYERVIIR